MLDGVISICSIESRGTDIRTRLSSRELSLVWTIIRMAIVVTSQLLTLLLEYSTHHIMRDP